MRLSQMALSYRREADVLRRRIQQVRALPPGTEREETARRERLRLLEAMRRDVRDAAMICEHYYDRSYHRSQRYMV